MNVVDLNFRAITGGREVENVSAMHQNLKRNVAELLIEPKMVA